MKRLLFICLITCIVCLTGCTTLSVTDFYHPFIPEDEKYLFADSCFLQEGETPSVFFSNDLDKDINKLQSKLFFIQGVSRFNGPGYDSEELEAKIVELCITERAQCALYSQNYTNTLHNLYSSSYGIYSSSTKRYDYTIVLFCMLPYPVYASNPAGFMVASLSDNDRENFHRNTGVMVNVVFDESAAYYANVFKGDLITEINGKEIKTLDDYYSIIEEAALSGQVSLKLLRNNIPLEITYTL